jgi:hypothetical protein
MAHSNTILSQIAAFFPRHEFEKLAKSHHVGQKFRSFSRWSQFLAMTIAQLSGRKSLRDITTNIKAQGHRIYHLGMRKTSRATLARVNEQQPYQMYKRLYFQILKKCRGHAPKHKFSFKGKVYLLDATTIDLCLKVFPWAKFRKAKGAIKLHFGIDADGYLPAIMNLSSGKSHEMLWARALTLHPGSCVVFDRGYNDYSWYQTLTKRKITFVTRLKSNAVVEHLGKWRNSTCDDVESDKRIRLKGMTTNLRLVTYKDPETDKIYHFLTNSFRLDAATVADLYKERWQIELFFKWIKQNLKVKTFLGTSKNAVLTQLWIALCVYLFLSFLKFKAKLGISLTTILRLLQFNLFEKRSLIDLLKPPDITELTVSPQLLLWNQL